MFSNSTSKNFATMSEPFMQIMSQQLLYKICASSTVEIIICFLQRYNVVPFPFLLQISILVVMPTVFAMNWLKKFRFSRLCICDSSSLLNSSHTLFLISHLLEPFRVSSTFLFGVFLYSASFCLCFLNANF